MAATHADGANIDPTPPTTVEEKKKMYSSGYAECGHGTISHEPFIPQAGTMERERGRYSSKSSLLNSRTSNY